MLTPIKAFLKRKLHKSIYKPGEYYSPVPSPQEIERVAQTEKKAFRPEDHPAINFNISNQLIRLETWLGYDESSQFCFTDIEESLFRPKNSFFMPGDAYALCSMLREFKPRRVIEIGSGFSTAVMLETSKRCGWNFESLTCIEPFPQRLKAQIGEEERPNFHLRRDFIQDVPPEVFEQLGDGDLLFVDTSHVVKAGSDLLHIFNEIIPFLKPGVLIHIHDIVFPFTYPSAWLREGIFWNEAYVLKQFLSYNDAFEILMFVDMFSSAAVEDLPKNPMSGAGGGSIYLRKLR